MPHFHICENRHNEHHPLLQSALRTMSTLLTVIFDFLFGGRRPENRRKLLYPTKLRTTHLFE